jgi:hypothetical protein
MSSPESFTLFSKFPAEIQLMILNHCSRLDLVCLSLTGPDFRALTLPIIRGKPRLTWVDQLGFTPGSSSPCVGQTGHGMCLSGKDKQVLYSPMSHRRKCHEVHYTAICWGCRQYSKEHPTCQVPRCKKHCTCISCPLFVRLRGWMGDRKYCASCNLFTTRTKKNNGRCRSLCLHFSIFTNSA